MKILKYIGVLSLILVALSACNDDDDDALPTVQSRDRGEQTAADDVRFMEFLKTHFYNYEAFEANNDNFDNKIIIAAKEGANIEKQSLFDQIGTKLTARKINLFGIEHTVYVLKAREGAGETLTFADSVFVNYNGMRLDETKIEGSNDTKFELGSTFDSTKTPIWFDLGRVGSQGGVILGFSMGFDGFKSASSIEKDNDTGFLIPSDDYGIGAVFIPTSLAYFDNPPTSIQQYQSLIFTFETIAVKSLDHDGDGKLSSQEDANANLFLRDDDQDGDGNPDFLDPDTK